MIDELASGQLELHWRAVTYEVGEDTREIAEMFRLDVHDVLAALRHEDRLRPLKIA
ncbi:MAG: hypothetical protein ACREMZ_16515 [Gemmatimonadales bacterium]